MKLLPALLFLTVVTLAATGVTAADPPRRPNIVLILLDDLGWGELGCQGNPEIPTPHIDSLARDGVRFTNGYVSSPYCSPSRAGLLTGRYPAKFRFDHNPIGAQNRDPQLGLPLSERTLADRLKAAGYATGLVGKWHLGGAPRFQPQRRGFDEFFGFLHEGHSYVRPGTEIVSRLRPNEPAYDEGNPLLRGTRPVEEPAYLTEAFTREAVSFVEKHRTHPFFLMLAYNGVHSPMQAPQRALDRVSHIRDPHRRLFAAMLTAVDDGVGRVLARVRELGLDQDTLVVCLSDNGGPTRELTSSNGVLRGGKGQLFEGGIRVPFLMRWSGRLAAGQVFDAPVLSLDIPATALDAAGVRTQPIEADGGSLLPYLARLRKGNPHTTMFWRYGANLAVRLDSWKLIRQATPGQPAPSFALYNLSEDPGETRDLSTVRADIAERLRDQVQRWDDRMRHGDR